MASQFSNFASTGYSEYVGTGYASGRFSSQKARTAMDSRSSPPLQHMILSGVTPCSSAAASRKAVPSGSGYRRSCSGRIAASASITFGDGGYGFSFVLSLTTSAAFG